MTLGTKPPKRLAGWDTVQPFAKACELAGIAPTRRQVSKYRRGLGLAYRFRSEAIIAIVQEAEGKEV